MEGNRGHKRFSVTIIVDADLDAIDHEYSETIPVADLRDWIEDDLGQAAKTIFAHFGGGIRSHVKERRS